MRLLRIGGWTVSGSDPSEIRARIEDLYAFPPARRTMTVLVHSLPAAMWPAMGRWYGHGAWGRYFDNPADGGCLRHSLLIRQPICVRAATRTLVARLR